MPFREMRGYLRDLSPSLTPCSILSISYFGRITSFICLTEPTASVVIDTLTDIGGRVDTDFQPWILLLKDKLKDAAAIK